MQVDMDGRGVGAALVLAIATSVIASVERSSSEATAVAHEVQTAVTQDGFVVSEAVRNGRRVTEVTRAGRTTSTYQRAGDVRIVGTSAGVLAVYEENRRIRLQRVSDRADGGMFGKSVRMLCDGVASTAARFAVGWLESDDGFWFVHGPVNRRGENAAMLEAEVQALAGKKEWCGIAGAEHKVALLWRDRDRLFLSTCTQKKCGGLAGAMKLDRSVVLLGFGCLRNACLLATRDRAGKTALSLMTESGSVKWTKPIDVADTHVSIVGAGDRAFAIGTGDRVVRVDRSGSMRDVWTGPGDGVPQVSWSAGTLLVARANGSTVAIDTVEMAR